METQVFSILVLILLGVANDVAGRSHSRHEKSNDGKIVGGNEVEITSFPNQVYLIILIGTNFYSCGGSIISPKYVMTAGHCLVGAIRIYIRAGSTNSDSGGKQYSTSLYTIHPNYNARTSDNDIAIIKLPRGMDLDGVTMKAVKLPSANTTVEAGTNVIVTGWGATAEGGSTTNILNAVTVPVTTRKYCNSVYDNKITERMFCAGQEEGGKDSCQGDSGGPAVNEETKEQYGVVSFGIGCAREGTPGVYTDVTFFVNWIKQITGIQS